MLICDRHVFEILLENKPCTVYLEETPHLRKHNWNNNRHSNACYELHMVLGGSCRLEVEENQYTLRQDQAVLIAPGHYHQVSSVPGAVEHLGISFSIPEGALLSAVEKRIPVCSVFAISKETAAICQSVFYEAASSNPFGREMMHAQVTQLLLLSFRELGIAAGGHAAKQDTQTIMRNDIIDQFFEQHFADGVTEEDLAAELHLSRRQLGRVLKSNYGMGFREKMQQARMDHAAWLLRNTERKICEVVGLVGYTSEAAFFQVFRKTFDMTPQQYRSQFLKSSEQLTGNDEPEA